MDSESTEKAAASASAAAASTRPETHPPAASLRMPFTSGRLALDKYRLEVLARTAVMVLIGLILATAKIPHLVPPSSSFMIGIMVASIPLSVPKFLMMLCTVVPILLGMMLTSLVLSTMILACINVSIDFMTVIYSILSVILSGLFFGKTYAKLSGFASALIALPGMLVVSFVPLVTSGLTAGDLWTASGTENPLAVFRNFLICICWSIMAIIVGVIIPPFRTSRKMLSSTIIPQCLSFLASVIENDDRLTESELDTFRNTLVHLIDSLRGKASMTAFEPRVWRVENLVVPLNELIENVLAIAECALVKHADNIPGGESYGPTLEILRLCISALETNDPDAYSSLKAYNPEQVEVEANNISYLTDITYRQTCQLRKTTLEWLEALNGSGGAPHGANEAIRNEKNNFLWIMLPLIPFPRIVEVITTIFRPSKWNFSKAMWAIEYAVGFIVLFCLSIYVAEWRNLGIGDDNSLYSGWHLLGYAFAWTPTVEGTTKKAFSRATGTSVGGFVGWLGVIVCSGSYDDNAPMNVYGTVVYITIFVVIATLLGINTGPAAMFGQNHDHGFTSMYFSMTLALVMLEVFSGSGDKTTITVNRIVATVTGVLMAVILQLLPPHVMGTKLDHTETFSRSLQDSFISILGQVLKDDSKHDFSEEKTMIEKAKANGDFAMFLLKDSDSLKCLPIFRVESGRQTLLEDMRVSCAFLTRLVDFITSDPESTRNVVDEHRSSFEEFLVCMKDGKVYDRSLPSLPQGIIRRDQKPKAFFYCAEFILIRLQKHEETIKKMVSTN